MKAPARQPDAIPAKQLDGALRPGKPHNARDIGPGTGHMLSTYIVETGQPLSSLTGEPPDR